MCLSSTFLTIWQGLDNFTSLAKRKFQERQIRGWVKFLITLGIHFLLFLSTWKIASKCMTIPMSISRDFKWLAWIFFADELPFLLKDEQYQKKFRVDLKDTVLRARRNPRALLKGYNICLTTHVHPHIEMFSAIVRSAGGDVSFLLNQRVHYWL